MSLVATERGRVRSILAKRHTCTWCRVVFRPKKSTRKSFCSRTCSYAFKSHEASIKKKYRSRVAVLVDCAECGEEFLSERGMKLCGDSCKRLRVCRQASRRMRFGCRECGNSIPFKDDNGRMPWHCGKCRDKARQRERATNRDRYGRTHRERANRYGVQYVSFSKRSIYDRDGWICGICGEPVDPNAKYPDMRCASLDHIKPLSLGGSHTPENVRLAHFDCNSFRGNGVDEEAETCA